MDKELRPAIFIDRDGTLVEDVGYLSGLEHLRVLKNSEPALSMLKSRGYRLIVVTNQSGIGRGYYDEAAMHTIHESLQRQVSGLLDAFYFCPHRPEDSCRCRKPGTEMIEQAMNDFEIDLPNSWIIGDKRLDIETGFNAGVSTALVLTGYGADHVRELEKMPDVVASDILEAARSICARFDGD